ncbi:MAG: DUF4292 domain-containing protein [Bacteroidia bacterium]|nr:DUF4292 domain-containing protein [Bacteroidia bacterium]
MNIRPLVLLLMLSTALWSCKSLKDISSGAVNWRTVEERALNERLDFHTVVLSGKAKLNFPGSGMENLSVNYRINIVKDSAIMIRVIKLIEAARILITPDSIFVQDRINSQLISCDFKIAEETVGLPADFGLLQDMLLGQYHPIPELLEPTQKRGTPKIFEGSAAGLAFIYELDAALAKPTRIFASDSLANRSVSIRYSDFLAGAGSALPQQGNIDVTGTDELSVSFTHRKVTFDEESTLASFDVPSGYTRTTCR